MFLYDSISICTCVVTSKITCAGTLSNSSKVIPAELKDIKDREEIFTILHYVNNEKNIALCTYTVITTSSGKKNVILLLTMRPLAGIAKDGKNQKPSIYTFYDYTKVGTGIVNKINDYYTTRIESRQ